MQSAMRARVPVKAFSTGRAGGFTIKSSAGRNCWHGPLAGVADELPMLMTRRYPAWGYVIAFLGSALVFAMRYSTDSALRGFFTSLAFLLVVLLAGLIGGWKPSILTTLICLANERFFFTTPKHS